MNTKSLLYLNLLTCLTIPCWFPSSSTKYYSASLASSSLKASGKIPLRLAKAGARTFSNSDNLKSNNVNNNDDIVENNQTGETDNEYKNEFDVSQGSEENLYYDDDACGDEEMVWEQTRKCVSRKCRGGTKRNFNTGYCEYVSSSSVSTISDYYYHEHADDPGWWGTLDPAYYAKLNARRASGNSVYYAGIRTRMRNMRHRGRG